MDARTVGKTEGWTADMSVGGTDEWTGERTDTRQSDRRADGRSDDRAVKADVRAGTGHVRDAQSGGQMGGRRRGRMAQWERGRMVRETRRLPCVSVGQTDGRSLRRSTRRTDSRTVERSYRRASLFDGQMAERTAAASVGWAGGQRDWREDGRTD